MNRRQLVLLAVSLAVLTATVTTESLQISGEFEFSLQQLYVTASTRGEPVADMRRDEFAIVDGGKRQDIVTFARGDIPFTAVLLVDASQSMVGEKIVSAQRGVRDFADRMRPLDEAKLVIFSDYIRAVSPFTSFPEILTAGLERVTAVGGTAINDAIDSQSALGMHHVLPSARRSQANVFLMRTHNSTKAASSGEPLEASSPWRDSRGHQAEFRQLLSLVNESGGRVIDVGSPAGIEAAFSEVISELRDHYVLGYYPNNQRGDGRWHKVRVKVSRPDVDLRTSSGYLDL
jgi:hypothetical protein